MGPFILNHLFVLENEGNETRQAGAGVRRQTGECHHCTCFPRCPLWTILICSTSEIYTRWLQPHQMSKVSSPVLLGGQVRLPGGAGFWCLPELLAGLPGREAAHRHAQASRPLLPPGQSHALSEQRPKCWKCADVHVVLNDKEQKVYKNFKVIM